MAGATDLSGAVSGTAPVAAAGLGARVKEETGGSAAGEGRPAPVARLS